MPIPFPPRRLFARLAAAIGASAMLAIALAAPAAASLPGVHYPTQSLGNRGTNVYAIQLLLRDQHGDGAANRFFCSIAEQKLGAAVPTRDQSLGRGQE